MNREEKKLIKLIREAIRKDLIKETIPDESFSDVDNGDLKAWLFYYKHFSQIAHEAIGKIIDLTTNNELSAKERLEGIVSEWKIYQTKASALPVPNLN